MTEATMNKDEEKDGPDSEDAPSPVTPKSENRSAKANTSSSGQGAVDGRSGNGFKNIWTIMLRELGSYFNTPLAYILICITLVGLGVHFFLISGGVWQANRASMALMMNFVPLVLCVVTLPLFTMRSLSEEKRMGTIEILITMPVKDSEVILGKFLSAFVMVGVQLGLLFLYPLIMFYGFKLGNFDWGPFWTAMLGFMLLSAAGIAIGLMFSSFTESQILAFFGTSVTLSALYALGYMVTYLKGTLGDVLAFVSLQTRFEPFSLGIIDTRAIVYFLSIAVFCTLVSFRNLESRKWS
jgi:ABC-2 type transport system permease protein